MRDLAAPILLDALEEGDPKHRDVLADTLRTLALLESPPRAELLRLASTRIPGYGIDDPRHWLWLTTWFQVDGMGAIGFVEGILTELDDPDAYVVSVCNALRGRHSDGIGFPNPDYLAPACLARLIPIVFGYVRLDEDIQRESGQTYTPTGRDEAQFIRYRLLEILAETDDRQAGRVLIGLLDHPEMAESRDWILHLTEARRKRLADGEPWDPKDIRDFARSFEIKPKSDHDLFKIAVQRLSDIRYLVEQAEVSARTDLRVGDLEPVWRTWFARKLRDSARDSYTVPQEEEIDLGKPDLRIEAPGMAAVPIELKCAYRWTGRELFERLENQLVGQYLRPHDAQYGVYLLVFKSGEQSTWKHPGNGRKLSFQALADALQVRADEIVADRNDLYNISVVGIDFSEP